MANPSGGTGNYPRLSQSLTHLTYLALRQIQTHKSALLEIGFKKAVCIPSPVHLGKQTMRATMPSRNINVLPAKEPQIPPEMLSISRSLSLSLCRAGIMMKPVYAALSGHWVVCSWKPMCNFLSRLALGSLSTCNLLQQR